MGQSNKHAGPNGEQTGKAMAGSVADRRKAAAHERWYPRTRPSMTNPMNALSRSVLIFVAVALVGCSRSPEPARTAAVATPASQPATAAAQHGDAIAWRNGDVD